MQRYTFGQLFLWDGIGLVPVTIGLFAIPEVIDLAVKGSSIAQQQIGKLGGVLEGVTVCMLVLNPLAKITQIRSSLLTPLIV